MHAAATGPALSVIVVSFNPAPLLERCLRSVVEQASPHGAEIIVVRADRPGAADAVRREFTQCRWVPAPPGETIPRMRWQGIAAARGEIVALIEDDCVVAGEWCAAVLREHREPWAAVGGAVEPGPYGRARDWAVYFYEYGRFMLPFAAQRSSVLPGNNVSYKRQLLIADRPPGDGFHEVRLHEAWRRKGAAMLITPTLVVTNANSWSARHVFVAPFHHGRVFAALRTAEKSLWSRSVLALLAPILPVLQTSRIIRLTVARKRHVGTSLRAVPWLFVFGASWGLGEAVGYVRGAGRSAAHWS